MIGGLIDVSADATFRLFRRKWFLTVASGVWVSECDFWKGWAHEDRQMLDV